MYINKRDIVLKILFTYKRGHHVAGTSALGTEHDKDDGKVA